MDATSDGTRLAVPLADFLAINTELMIAHFKARLEVVQMCKFVVVPAAKKRRWGGSSLADIQEASAIEEECDAGPSKRAAQEML